MAAWSRKGSGGRTTLGRECTVSTRAWTSKVVVTGFACRPSLQRHTLARAALRWDTPKRCCREPSDCFPLCRSSWPQQQSEMPAQLVESFDAIVIVRAVVGLVPACLPDLNMPQMTHAYVAALAAKYPGRRSGLIEQARRNADGTESRAHGVRSARGAASPACALPTLAGELTAAPQPQAPAVEDWQNVAPAASQPAALEPAARERATSLEDIDWRCACPATPTCGTISSRSGCDPHE